MLNEVLQQNNEKNSVNEFLNAVRQGIPSAVFGVNEAFKNYIVSNIESKVLFVVKDDITANTYAEYIRSFSGKRVSVVYSKDEILVPNRAFSKERTFKRLYSLKNVKDADVIITTPDALMQTFPKEILSYKFVKGQNYERGNYLKELIEMGYKRVEEVESQGTFAVRGDLLDVYPVGSENPAKIDFFGDAVERIKFYDEKTRETIKLADEIELIQSYEVVFTQDDLTKIKSSMREELKKCKGDLTRLKTVFDDCFSAMEYEDYDALSVFSSLSSNCTDFTEFIDKDTVVVIDEGKRVKDSADLYEREFTERYKSLLSGGEIFSFEKLNCIGYEELKSLLNKYRITAVQTLSSAIPFFEPLRIINPNVSGVADYRSDFKEAYSDINNWLYGGYRVIACADDKRKADMFCDGLYSSGHTASINPKSAKAGVSVFIEKLNGGFIFHEDKTVLLGSANLFLKSVAKRKVSKKQTFFSAPEAGDYCVHEIHGIGRALGNKRITTTEGTKDYIAVEYNGGDILYVPVEQMDILTRYLGGEKSPKLSKIGGTDFERIKQSVKDSIKKMSFDLKKLYEERNSLSGYKFTPDTELETLFTKAFNFEDTVDQAEAVKEIREDMVNGKVMDRLVCGDVGFGKTEVAFRAVFLAIINGKQVAMLAPTTILTEQHYNTAIERFKGFGINIACLNRFKTKKEQEKILEKLKSGEIDFIIGTHRLLSKDVEFKDLGLLVLDEEQRFGVEHKEKIKLLKKNVDTLTLTATPIPRTLHMSLSGIREISTINTPPLKRLPVQTYVTEETDALIIDAVMREKNRGGQTFIMYNRVESIFTFAERMKTVLKGIKITVVHGQMEERLMEQNIMSFYKGESDLLISTTIIENGIDLPKANTLIVIDADRLGLSTLYQLKGRVGRSDRLAYAYFTYKREKILSESAYNRLNAISEFTEMGSGIKIAMRDLEIRGAGNVLGVEQHGHMDKIGYELYAKLLKEELEGKKDVIAELDVRVSAFIPESYIESRSARMDAYKEIAETDGENTEKQIRESLESEYGPLPEEVKNLITVATVKYLAKSFSVKEINVTKDACNFVFEDFKVFGDKKLANAIDNSGIKTKILMQNKPVLEFIREDRTNEEMLYLMREFLSYAKE